ncbi:MAG: hypothetical protein ACK5O3_14625 [Burkholderiales bacterium]
MTQTLAELLFDIQAQSRSQSELTQRRLPKKESILLKHSGMGMATQKRRQTMQAEQPISTPN